MMCPVLFILSVEPETYVYGGGYYNWLSFFIISIMELLVLSHLTRFEHLLCLYYVLIYVLVYLHNLEVQLNR